MVEVRGQWLEPKHRFKFLCPPPHGWRVPFPGRRLIADRPGQLPGLGQQESQGMLRARFAVYRRANTYGNFPPTQFRPGLGRVEGGKPRAGQLHETQARRRQALPHLGLPHHDIRVEHPWIRTADGLVLLRAFHRAKQAMRAHARFQRGQRRRRQIQVAPNYERHARTIANRCQLLRPITSVGNIALGSGNIPDRAKRKRPPPGPYPLPRGIERDR